MPAFRILAIVTILCAATAAVLPTSVSRVREQPSMPMSSATPLGLEGALRWLSNNQSSDGSYGAFLEHWAAAAAYALWLNDTGSSKANLSYSWLSIQLDNSSSWFWKYTEADVPGAVLASMAGSGNLHRIHVSSVASSLLQLQQSNGGFIGYYSSAAGQLFTSSVDTAESLRGLIESNAINASSERSAVNYLLALQNPDGSFNLTKTSSYDPLYSQGPEPVSITALVLLALKDASYSSSNSIVSKALNFINATANYSTLSSDTNAVYSAAIAALAFQAFGERTSASNALAFILSHQNPDGGFADSIRSSTSSNALDTGWVSIALELVGNGVAPTAFLPQLITLGIFAAIIVVGIVAGVLIYWSRRKRT